MGMYTAFHFNVELKKDVPRDVIERLDFMLASEHAKQEDFLKRIDHPLFGDTRWRGMLRCDSACFPMRTRSILFEEYDRWHLNVQCNLKNYNSEIEMFIDWIMPYVASGAGPNDWLGYRLYEEDESPTNIFL